MRHLIVLRPNLRLNLQIRLQILLVKTHILKIHNLTSLKFNLATLYSNFFGSNFSRPIYKNKTFLKYQIKSNYVVNGFDFTQIMANFGR